jgi:hypothetical protein
LETPGLSEWCTGKLSVFRNWKNTTLKNTASQRFLMLIKEVKD